MSTISVQRLCKCNACLLWDYIKQLYDELHEQSGSAVGRLTATRPPFAMIDVATAPPILPVPPVTIKAVFVSGVSPSVATRLTFAF